MLMRDIDGLEIETLKSIYYICSNNDTTLYNKVDYILHIKAYMKIYYTFRNRNERMRAKLKKIIKMLNNV